MNFRVCIVIGDRKGRVGYGVSKGADVQAAVQKAVNQANKNLIRIPLKKDTIPHRVEAKYKAAKVMIKPAPRGSGVIAGGATRTILEMAGVPNASAKMLGNTSNKITNAKATFAALTSFIPRAMEVTVRPVKAKEVVKEVVVPAVATEKKKSDAPATKKPSVKKAAAPKKTAEKKNKE